jgi:phosphoribosylcarboxyaminoimidazole (NCAIR) mutase
VACLTVLEPQAAALAAVKMLAVSDPGLAQSIRDYHKLLERTIVEDDEAVSDGSGSPPLPTD